MHLLFLKPNNSVSDKRQTDSQLFTLKLYLKFHLLYVYFTIPKYINNIIIY